jgi:NADPH:quinone reductase-like Zn-dependent oxidoreductase
LDKVKVHVTKSFPVANAKAALAEVEAGKVRGKLVLIFN